MKLIIEIEPKELLELNKSLTKVAFDKVIQSIKIDTPTISEFTNETLKNLSEEIKKSMANY